MKTSKLFCLFLLIAPLPLLGQNREVQLKASKKNSIGMEFVLVQPGTFQMGSDYGLDERPIHAVTISKPFYIAKYEVTQKQWRNVMGTNPSKDQGDNRPVGRVRWDDAQVFIRRVNEKEGTTKYRLPTEAEWEFAARGGVHSKGYTYSGSNTVGDVAWYYDNSGMTTHPVGQKTANELGIFDMSGNVWEWCSNWYYDYGGSAERDPKGPTSGRWHVLRGGSFSPGVGSWCVANRFTVNDPSIRFDDDGFRCVWDP